MDKPEAPEAPEFEAARRSMIDAFAKLSMLATRAGADEDAVTDTHGQFFDGNVDLKKAWAAR